MRYLTQIKQTIPKKRAIYAYNQGKFRIKRQEGFAYPPLNFVNINNKQRPPHEYQFLPLSRGSQRGSEQAEFEAVQTTPNPS